MGKLTRQQFIEKLAPYAMVDMSSTGVAASLTIAQGILESADGNSSLTVQANNLFGIKGNGIAGSITMPTKEYVNGKPVVVNAKFRKYNNWGESVLDHSALFINGVSWNRDLYRNVIDKDGIEAAKAVAAAGYATDPQYANKLIKLIQDHNLMQYDIKYIDTDVSYENRIMNLEDEIDSIKITLNSLYGKLKEIPAPDWFNEEFPYATEILSQKTGTIDFWRSYAATMRMIQ